MPRWIRDGRNGRKRRRRRRVRGGLNARWGGGGGMRDRRIFRTIPQRRTLHADPAVVGPDHRRLRVRGDNDRLVPTKRNRVGGGVGSRGALGFLPLGGECRVVEHGADMEPFRHAHRCPRLCDGRHDAEAGECLDEDSHRGETAEVDRGAGPVKDHSLEVLLRAQRETSFRKFARSVRAEVGAQRSAVANLMPARQTTLRGVVRSVSSACSCARVEGPR